METEEIPKGKKYDIFNKHSKSEHIINVWLCFIIMILSGKHWLEVHYIIQEMENTSRLTWGTFLEKESISIQWNN